MKVILGAGGVAHEIAWLMGDTQGTTAKAIIPDAFVVSDADWVPNVSIDDVPVLSESQLFLNASGQTVDVYVAVGRPLVKRRALAAIHGRLKCSFPTLVHHRVSIDHREGKVSIGQGTIIYPGASLTTQISIGDFVHMNPGATVAHDCTIGDFTTLCPGALVSGHVKIGSGCFIGAGAIIKEGVTIADDCLIGAGAVVVNDIKESGTWMGIPARRMGL